MKFNNNLRNISSSREGKKVNFVLKWGRETQIYRSIDLIHKHVMIHKCHLSFFTIVIEELCLLLDS